MMGSQILVIEDNPPNLDLMVYLLEAFGHRPLAARTGEEGLEIIQRQTLDLIICDIQLPGIDGYRIARWLKSHPTLSRIPLVAVTALAMVGDRDRVLATGFDGYISKPIAPETFVREVEAFLEPVNGLTRGGLRIYRRIHVRKRKLRPISRDVRVCSRWTTHL